jgi:spore coat polysaccharide biosynthesis protein SpsF
MNIVTVIQARTGSTRLPNKVMMPILGKPLLLRMSERVLQSRLKGTVVIATTDDPSDDTVVNLCAENGLNHFRGDRNDLLDRHYRTALAYRADVVLKIPSDCPLIDPKIIDKTIEFFLAHEGEFDYVGNLYPASYPDGNDVEIMTFPALEKAWKEATRKLEREHTTPYLWENPDKFRLANVPWELPYDYSKSHRRTIDYLEDYLFVKAVYEELYPSDPHFDLNAILRLCEDKPDIFDLNSKYAGVTWHRNHLSELKNLK